MFPGLISHAVNRVSNELGLCLGNEQNPDTAFQEVQITSLTRHRTRCQSVFHVATTMVSTAVVFLPTLDRCRRMSSTSEHLHVRATSVYYPVDVRSLNTALRRNVRRLPGDRRQRGLIHLLTYFLAVVAGQVLLNSLCSPKFDQLLNLVLCSKLLMTYVCSSSMQCSQFFAI